jgi:hypothetical protein
MDTVAVYLQEIIIDEGFKKFLPSLDDDTFTWLERSLLEYGCQNPLVLWQNILIDGHNRYEIIQKHNLPFNTLSMEFDSREDVIIWIITTQVARRNLNPTQLSYFRGTHYNTEKVRLGSVNQHTRVANVQSEQEQVFGSTAERLSDHYSVSPMTIRRDGRLADGINTIGESSPEAKELILSGHGNISRTQLRELSSGTQQEIDKVANMIVDGTNIARRPGKSEELAGQLSIKNFVTKIAHEVNSKVQQFGNGSNNSRAVLRALIVELEALFRDF